MVYYIMGRNNKGNIIQASAEMSKNRTPAQDIAEFGFEFAQDMEVKMPVFGVIIGGKK